MHEGSGEHFATTHWSVVMAAHDSPRALERLLRAYWGPIYAFLRRSGYARPEAADLTQEFVAKVMIERRLAAQADPERGRFRTFLRAALRNFLIDQNRRSTASVRAAPDRPLSLEASEMDVAEPGDAADPGEAFDRQWAASVLSAAVDRLARECRRDGLARHWEAFEAAVLIPAVSCAEPPTYADLAPRLGAADGDEVSALVHTVRRRFRKVLADVVSQTAESPEDVEQELAYVRAVLGVP